MSQISGKSLIGILWHFMFHQGDCRSEDAVSVSFTFLDESSSNITDVSWEIDEFMEVQSETDSFSISARSLTNSIFDIQMEEWADAEEKSQTSFSDCFDEINDERCCSLGRRLTTIDPLTMIWHDAIWNRCIWFTFAWNIILDPLIHKLRNWIPRKEYLFLLFLIALKLLY